MSANNKQLLEVGSQWRVLDTVFMIVGYARCEDGSLREVIEWRDVSTNEGTRAMVVYKKSIIERMRDWLRIKKVEK